MPFGPDEATGAPLLPGVEPDAAELPDAGLAPDELLGPFGGTELLVIKLRHRRRLHRARLRPGSTRRAATLCAASTSSGTSLQLTREASGSREPDAIASDVYAALTAANHRLGRSRAASQADLRVVPMGLGLDTLGHF